LPLAADDPRITLVRRTGETMRLRIVSFLALAVLAAACGGAASGTPKANATPAGGQPSAAQSATKAPAGNGSIDCAKIKAAGVELLSLQFLAQLKTPATIEAIRTKQVGNLDIDTFLGAMHDLHALDGSPSPLGDPKAAIAYYEKAGNAAKVLFATKPMTQAAIDTYNQNVGTVGDFLSRQISISAAIDQAHC
jgi:hypothetical protein